MFQIWISNRTRKTNLLRRVLPGIFWLYAGDGKS
jgi:hypothetical protein